MAEQVHYGSLKTSWGTLWVVVTKKGLLALSFRKQPAGKLAEGLEKRVEIQLARDSEVLKPYETALANFLDGRSGRVKMPIDLRGESDFARRVYDVIQKIPLGETRSYAQVASSVGGRQFARAVGQALSANPIPIIIPCHRVVGSDGKLGGFSSGLTWKRRLLALERGQQVLVVK